jgi:hypothetical protein
LIPALRPAEPEPAEESAESRMQARGRALAILALEQMVDETKRRAAAHRLDRGLTLSLPYFDDRVMGLRWRDLVVIPRGRVPFLPAFVVLAAEHEKARVTEDDRLTTSTRQHLIEILDGLGEAFRSPEADAQG